MIAAVSAALILGLGCGAFLGVYFRNAIVNLIDRIGGRW